MIDVYTVSNWYGEPIVKQTAKKCTGKTVTFLDGRREGMQNEFRQHFTDLSDAIEFFERSQSENKARFEVELNRLREREATFYAFVAGERGEE